MHYRQTREESRRNAGERDEKMSSVRKTYVTARNAMGKGELAREGGR